MKLLWKLFLGAVSNSRAGEFSTADLLAAVRDAAIVAAIVFIENLDTFDFGTFDAAIAAVVMFAVSGLRRLRKGYVE